MASLRVLAFDHEGRPVQFDSWLDDLQLYLLSDSTDSVSLFDLASSAATAPPATADTQALYDAVVARYSSPATAALGRLLLPYLFPELFAFTTVEDLASHLRATDARYRAAVPAEDHFLSLDPTSLTVDLLEQHLLAAETSAVADVGAASASARCRSSKGKGGRGGGGGSGGGGGGSGSGSGGSSGGGGGGGAIGGSGGFGGGRRGTGGSGGRGGGGTGSGGTGARGVGSEGGQHQQQQRWSEIPSPQQLREWFLRGASGGSFPYVIRTGDRAGQTCGRLHTQHRCFSHLNDAWRAEFGDNVKLPRLANKSRIAIFDLDFDAILSAIYALSVSAEGDCYRCVPPDPGMATAPLGASESGTLPGTTPAEALHTFTLDSGASRCFFRDSTILAPLPAPVPVRLADPSEGPDVARSSTVLPCPAVPSGSLSGLHLPSFSTNLVSAAAACPALPPLLREAAARRSSLLVFPDDCSLADSPHGRRLVFPSQDITFDKSVSFYRIFPYRSAPPPPPPLFLATGPPPLDPLPPQGPAPLRVPQVDPLPGPAPIQVAVDSGAAPGVASRGAEPGGAESKGAETGGAKPGGVETGGAERGGVATGSGATGSGEPGGSAGASPRQSPQQLREWFVRRTCLWSGAAGTGGAIAAGAGVTGGTVTTGPGGARTRGTGAAGTCGVGGAGAGDLTECGPTGTGGAGAGGAAIGDPGAGGAGVGGPGVAGARAGGAGAVAHGGTLRPRPYFVPLLHKVLGTPPSAALTPPLLCPPPDQSQPPLQPASPLPAPSPYTEQSGGLTERREPASRPVPPVRTARRVPRSRPPLVPGTHAMALRPSSVPLRVFLPAPPESSLPETAAAFSLVAESTSASPQSVGGEFALGTDVLEDRQEDFECLTAAVPRFASMLLAPEGDPDAPDIPTPRSYAEAITGPYSSQWQTAMDAEMASWKSTGTYVDEVPPPGANIFDGMWIFRGKRPPGSPPAFKARYVARGFS
ncbi:unnamed protein product [Closterium sp. NIES-53]